MWKHRNCGGQLHPLPGNDAEFCSKCGHYIWEDSQAYIEHYIINPDGNVIGDLGGSHNA